MRCVSALQYHGDAIGLGWSGVGKSRRYYTGGVTYVRRGCDVHAGTAKHRPGRASFAHEFPQKQAREPLRNVALRIQAKPIFGPIIRKAGNLNASRLSCGCWAWVMGRRCSHLCG